MKKKKKKVVKIKFNFNVPYTWINMKISLFFTMVDYTSIFLIISMTTSNKSLKKKKELFCLQRFVCHQDFYLSYFFISCFTAKVKAIFQNIQ